MELMEELKQKYNPEGSDLRKIQCRALELLLEFDRVCQKYDIPYWLSSGTLLGAVRHGGFIPWDDDLDVEVMRKDYKRLLKLLSMEVADRYAVQTFKTDPYYFNFYAKLRDTNSELAEAEDAKNYKYQGVFIDIFPMGYGKPLLGRLSVRINRYGIARLRPIKKNRFHLRCMRLWYRFIMFIYALFRFVDMIIPMNKVNFPYGAYYRLNCPRESIFPLTKIKFEGHYFSAPHDWDTYLKCCYGDYMQIPEETDRAIHNLEIISFREN